MLMKTQYTATTLTRIPGWRWRTPTTTTPLTTKLELEQARQPTTIPTMNRYCFIKYINHQLNIINNKKLSCLGSYQLSLRFSEQATVQGNEASENEHDKVTTCNDNDWLIRMILYQN